MFDIEDFINPRSLRALMTILKLLKKYDIRSMFFITGHMAERIEKCTTILELLENHEIGYHSSSHSVRPIIPEFTDTRSYSRAVKESLLRETSHINPYTGEPEGEGGIKILRRIFDNKDIISFRAPGNCWTPPHLEALQKLGIRFDFSAHLFGSGLPSNDPVAFKGVTFHPFNTINFDLNFSAHQTHYTLGILFSVLKRKTTCLCGHENTLVNAGYWDSIYMQSNPKLLTKIPPLNDRETVTNFKKLDMLLKCLKTFKKLGTVDVTPSLEEERSKELNTKNLDVLKTYRCSIEWVERFFNYHPKHVLSHFYEYFSY